MVVFDDWFVVLQFNAVLADYVSAGFVDDGVACCGVPFPDGAQSGIDVGASLGDGAEFEGTAPGEGFFDV